MNPSEIDQNKAHFLALSRQYISRPGLEDLLASLDKTDFFTAPSSSAYHLNEPGGLCQHSLGVFHTALTVYHSIVHPAIERGTSPFTKAVSDESIAIVSLFHDLCKAGIYRDVEKWKKDDSGRWQSYRGYKVVDDFPFGHGEKSVLHVSHYLQLTSSEMLAIRWHMGMFDVGESGSPSRYALYAALAKSPLVCVLQVADQLVANCLEQTNEV